MCVSVCVCSLNPGIEMLWEGGRWQELLGGTDPVTSPLMSSPPLDSVPHRETALRRGLLTALLRMSASAEVRGRHTHTRHACNVSFNCIHSG